MTTSSPTSNSAGWLPPSLRGALGVWLMVSLFASACRGHAPPPPPPDLQPPPVPPAVEEDPAGRVEGGRWRDSSYTMSLDVPEGWVVASGVASGESRVQLRHVATGTQVEVRASLDAGAPGPEPGEGCQWDFSDQGLYRTLLIPGPLTVATCYPEDPAGDSMFAVMTRADDVSWCFLVSTPSGRMLEGLGAAHALLETVRFR